jgi:hypothetical protein
VSVDCPVEALVPELEEHDEVGDLRRKEPIVAAEEKWPSTHALTSRR